MPTHAAPIALGTPAPVVAALYSAQTLQRTYNRVASALTALDHNDPTYAKQAARLSKGWALFFMGAVHPSKTPGTFYIEGSKGVVYLATRLSCECPDAQHRAVECKHQIAVRCLEYARAAEQTARTLALEARRKR